MQSNNVVVNEVKKVTHAQEAPDSSEVLYVSQAELTSLLFLIT
jgi:hypothetical protein